MTENIDQKHLQLISTFHYVVGGILVFFACMPLIHFSVGIAIMSGALDGANNANQGPPVFFGAIFAVMGALFFIIGQALAWLIIYSGKQIKKREHYTFSFVLACVMCMFMPLGTILGIFTIILLSKESIKQLYKKTF